MVISDDEVEQLLQQAQTLVDEIAETTEPAFTDDTPESVPTTEEPTASEAEAEAEFALASTATNIEEPAPDAAQAVEATDEIARELADMIDQAPIAPPADDVPATEQPVADSPTLDDEFRNAVLEEIVEELESGNPTESAPVEPVESMSRDVVPATPEVPMIAEAPAPPEVSPPPPAEPVQKVPFKTRLASIGRMALRALMIVPISLVNLALRLMMLLDRPFASLSLETKLRIGLVSLITIFMGAAVWVLPRVAAHNPYVEMEAPTQAAESHH